LLVASLLFSFLPWKIHGIFIFSLMIRYTVAIFFTYFFEQYIQTVSLICSSFLYIPVHHYYCISIWKHNMRLWLMGQFCCRKYFPFMKYYNYIYSVIGCVCFVVHLLKMDVDDKMWPFSCVFAIDTSFVYIYNIRRLSCVCVSAPGYLAILFTGAIYMCIFYPRQLSLYYFVSNNHQSHDDPLAAFNPASHILCEICIFHLEGDEQFLF